MFEFGASDKSGCITIDGHSGRTSAKDRAQGLIWDSGSSRSGGVSCSTDPLLDSPAIEKRRSQTSNRSTPPLPIGSTIQCKAKLTITPLMDNFRVADKPEPTGPVKSTAFTAAPRSMGCQCSRWRHYLEVGQESPEQDGNLRNQSYDRNLESDKSAAESFRGCFSEPLCHRNRHAVTSVGLGFVETLIGGS